MTKPEATEKNPTSVKELLRALATAPDSQIDTYITLRLRALSEQERPDAYELKRILDECAYGALASDFAMVAMQETHKQMMREIYP